MTLNMVLDHLYLVLISVVLTIAIGVPIGIVAYLYKGPKRVILAVCEILQTIPALALLGMIMVVLGGGKPTVIVGLILYSLLPVVQNTYIGLCEVDPAIKEVAKGMGMTRSYRLSHVELPLAFPLIFAGIRIATVTSVGIAVFASNVGGGGLGGIINRAIKTQDMSVIISSTLVLMAMAIVFDTVMGFVEKYLRGKNAPKGSIK